jgi:hypothetical protein
MAEFTPTTDQVRAMYATGALGSRTDMTTDDALAEFDRWLAALRETAEAVIAAWVDTGYRTALAGIGRPSNEHEVGKVAGIEQMRHLHLAEPWLPAHWLIEKIAAAAQPAAHPTHGEESADA